MTNKIQDIAQALVADGKGILAADESTATIGKRLATINVESTADTRRDYRHMLFSSTEAMSNCISGVILYDETIRQSSADGKQLTQIIQDNGALVGIKVDTGAKPLAKFPNETITEGLDNLSQRLIEYYELGARFAKWRAVIAINNDSLPTYGAIMQNAEALARYAALCQSNNIVPIVEPEILMDGTPGDHSIERCQEVTTKVLNTVFRKLRMARVELDGIILKPNMVIDGKNARKASVEEVAERTVKTLKDTVPASVAGIAFLSGGQNDLEATQHLAAINAIGNLPWPVTFSYGRALQSEALKVWAGKPENVTAAQAAFSKHAQLNSKAATRV